MAFVHFGAPIRFRKSVYFQTMTFKNVAVVSSESKEGKVAGGLLVSQDNLDNASLLFCSPEVLVHCYTLMYYPVKLCNCVIVYVGTTLV